MFTSFWKKINKCEVKDVLIKTWAGILSMYTYIKSQSCTFQISYHFVTYTWTKLKLKKNSFQGKQDIVFEWVIWWLSGTPLPPPLTWLIGADCILLTLTMSCQSAAQLALSVFQYPGSQGPFKIWTDLPTRFSAMERNWMQTTPWVHGPAHEMLLVPPHATLGQCIFVFLYSSHLLSAYSHIIIIIIAIIVVGSNMSYLETIVYIWYMHVSVCTHTQTHSDM